MGNTILRVRHHQVLLVAVVCCCLHTALPATGQVNTVRNVILILSDDHRYDFMGFMGRAGYLETPAMDRMASSGGHIRNAFVSTALCSPSRASILTGQYAHRHGVVDNNTDIRPDVTFFPQLLQQAGYQTAFFGKWHMGGDSDEPRPGFNKWVSFRGQGVYHNPTLNIDGRQQQVEGYTTDLLTDYALDWLKARSSEKPFFLYLSHKAVHHEFEPAPRHAGKYEGKTFTHPSTMADTDQNYRGKPAWVRAQRFGWHGVEYMYHGQFTFDTFVRRYSETLLALDESIGRVLDYVDHSGLAGNTLVIYMGDNGFSFGEHGLIDKRHMYEESMRVPLLVYAPSLVKPGTRITQMVQNIDLAPTILSLAGVPVPENVDGRSFLPLLRGEAIPWRDAVLYEYYWERNFPHTPTMFGIRTDRHKYIYYHGLWDTDELYDLEADPEEKANLIDYPAASALVKDLQGRLFDLLDKTDGMSIPLRRPSGGQMNARKND